MAKAVFFRSLSISLWCSAINKFLFGTINKDNKLRTALALDILQQFLVGQPAKGAALSLQLSDYRCAFLCHFTLQRKQRDAAG